jgi:DNA-directed RNA polymerase subunit RPC12/RpoP
MAYLPCDKCGKITNTQGSWDTPITILCEKCSDKIIKKKNANI